VTVGTEAAVDYDFDGDGRADILWRNAVSGENYLFPMNGTAIDAGEGYLRTVADLNWDIVGVGDFDGDARSDILWRNFATGENYVYLMNGTTIVGEGFITTVADLDWRVAGVGDFDGNGRSDILWRNTSTGDNYVYLMDGLAIAGQGILRSVPDLDWRVAAVADFDGDGNDDILWRNGSTGENYLYPMDGITIGAGEGFLRTVADLKWDIAGAGDFNGDGRSDILWRNASTGENYVYLVDGTAITGEGYIRTVADLNWDVAALGDYDGDGKADILWRNGATGENYLFPMDGFAIKPSEGYVRTIADQNWHVVYGSPWPEGFAMDAAASLLAEPVRYTAASVDVRQTMLSDTALSNVATFFGLNGSVDLGTFDGLPLEQRTETSGANTLFQQGVDTSGPTFQLDADTTVAQRADPAQQLADHAQGDWMIVSQDDKPAGKKASRIDWKGLLASLGAPLFSRGGHSRPAQPNIADFNHQPGKGKR